MGTEKPLSASAPPLAVRAQGSDRTLPAGPSYTIGRDPKSDIVVNEDRVSWQHAFLRIDHGSWVLVDACTPGRERKCGITNSPTIRYC